MINNRQNGRRRGRGGQRSQGGGSQGSRDNGNRIDSRARGNASQLYEKYKNMASDAQRQGDRVNTEYYLQFADHYFRVLADQRGRYEDQNQPQRRSHNDFDGDDDYGDEGEPIRADEQGRAGDDRQNDGNRARSDRDDDQQYDGNRNDGQRQEGQRQEGSRHEGQRYEGQRGERGDNRQRDGRERPLRREPRRDERANADVNAGQRTAEQAPSDMVRSQPQSQPQSQSQPRPELQPSLDVGAEAAPAPKRRGRPRKVAAETGEQLGLDASALPPSIGAEAPSEDAAPKPRRRRASAAPAEIDA